MADLEHYTRLSQAFAPLLQDLSTTWPKEDLQYVREEVEHSEFGEALENLIAVGLQNNKGFNPVHIRQIEELAAAMEMMDSPFLLQLRQANVGREGHVAA